MTREPDVTDESDGFHRPHVNSALLVSVQSVVWTVAASTAAVAGWHPQRYRSAGCLRRDRDRRRDRRRSHSSITSTTASVTTSCPKNSNGLLIASCWLVCSSSAVPPFSGASLRLTMEQSSEPSAVGVALAAASLVGADRPVGKETTSRTPRVQQRAALRWSSVGDWCDASRGHPRWNSSDAVAGLALGRRRRDHHRRVCRGDPCDRHMAGRASTVPQNPPSDDRTPHRSSSPRDHRCDGLAARTSPHAHRAPGGWTGNSGAVSPASADRSCQHLGRCPRGSTRCSGRHLAHPRTCNMDRCGRRRRHYQHGAGRSHRSAHPQTANGCVERVSANSVIGTWTQRGERCPTRHLEGGGPGPPQAFIG